MFYLLRLKIRYYRPTELIFLSSNFLGTVYAHQYIYPLFDTNLHSHTLSHSWSAEKVSLASSS